MPTALIQPPQFGSRATQLKRIGNLRSSRRMPACAEPPGMGIRPGNAMQRAAAPRSIQPRVVTQRAKTEARSKMLAGSETATKRTRIMNMIPQP
jgi:hypothetical protein